jgi:PAS domain S-box-containing protein
MSNERALQRSELRYRRVFECAHDGILILNADTGQIEDANPFMTDLLGYTHDQFVGKQLWEIGLFNDIEQSKAAFCELQAKGTIRYDDLPLQDKNGVCRQVEFVSNVYDVGDQKAIQCNIRDITQRKRAEQEKLNLERRLVHAQRLESIAVLAGGIAHDFNNILAGIMGYADLVQSRLPESESAREDIEVIKKSVRRAADLTRQLLAFAGEGKLVVEPVNLSQLVEDSNKMLTMCVSEKATVTYNLASDLPTTLADTSQIHQVILNLVINASEALGEQSGVIAISTDAIQCNAADCAAFGGGGDLPEGRYVRLEVADTGCGMDQDTMGKVFDPFFTTKFTGRGLGLAAVHGIVRGHKGAIRVFSEPAKGTKFQVLFPASDAIASPSAA